MSLSEYWLKKVIRKELISRNFNLILINKQDSDYEREYKLGSSQTEFNFL